MIAEFILSAVMVLTPPPPATPAFTPTPGSTRDTGPTVLVPANHCPGSGTPIAGLSTRTPDAFWLGACGQCIATSTPNIYAWETILPTSVLPSITPIGTPGAGTGTPGAGTGTPGAGTGTPGAGTGTPTPVSELPYLYCGGFNQNVSCHQIDDQTIEITLSVSTVDGNWPHYTFDLPIGEFPEVFYDINLSGTSCYQYAQNSSQYFEKMEHVPYLTVFSESLPNTFSSYAPCDGVPAAKGSSFEFIKQGSFYPSLYRGIEIVYGKTGSSGWGRSTVFVYTAIFSTKDINNPTPTPVPGTPTATGMGPSTCDAIPTPTNPDDILPPFVWIDRGNYQCYIIDGFSLTNLIGSFSVFIPTVFEGWVAAVQFPGTTICVFGAVLGVIKILGISVDLSWIGTFMMVGFVIKHFISK